MEPVNFNKAYYVKLGSGGEYEQSSISESKLRFGFGGQSLEDINSSNWEKIRKQLSTRDLNVLRRICESTPEDLWIIFSQGMMWWCRLGAREIYQDNRSKYRLVDGKWWNQDIHGHIFEIHSIPGVLSKTQAFRGTVCRVQQLDTLRRLVNDEPSPESKKITEYNKALVESVEKGISKLNPKDFEIFIDLVFRESGWRRLSMLGGTMKAIDLELEDPITEDKYQVQIKTHATFEEFESYAKQFNPQPPLRWLYFVVHSPDKKLEELRNPWPNVKLIKPGQLSEMVVRLGLVDWLKAHIK